MTDQLATLRVAADEGSTRVAIAGEIDLSNAASVQAEVEDVTTDADAVSLDLSDVTYVDSSGVRALLSLARAFAARGVSFRVIAPADSIAGGVLRITQVEEIEVVDSVD